MGVSAGEGEGKVLCRIISTPTLCLPQSLLLRTCSEMKASPMATASNCPTRFNATPAMTPTQPLKPCVHMYGRV